jgi:hypothetical protein
MEGLSGGGGIVGQWVTTNSNYRLCVCVGGGWSSEPRVRLEGVAHREEEVRQKKDDDDDVVGHGRN